MGETPVNFILYYFTIIITTGKSFFVEYWIYWIDIFSLK